MHLEFDKGVELNAERDMRRLKTVSHYVSGEY